ncbi:MAG: type III secretion system chaperone [Bilophila sp.]
MNFDQMLADLGSLLGLENFAKTEDGNVTVRYDDVFTTIDYFNEHVYMLTKIAAVPDDKLSAYSFLLEANSFGKMDGYVGVTSEHDAIIFVTKIPEQLAEACTVAKRLEKHVNAAETLMNGLASLSDSTEERAQTVNDLPLNGVFLKA